MIVRLKGLENPRLLWWIGVCAAVGLVLQSHPMMHPGFDMWHHLATIENPPPPGHTAYRHPFWYAVWGFIFSLLEISDKFTRALIIHRGQFLLSGILIYWAAKLAINATQRNSKDSIISIPLLALFSTYAWFFMLGTVSMVAMLGEASKVQQAWIMWYSINYQISLPIYILSTSLLLSIIEDEKFNRKKLTKLSFLAILLVLVAVIHAAEMVYFIYCIGIFAAVYLRGKKAWFILGGFAVLFPTVVYITLHYSYRTPEIITLLLQGNINLILEKLNYYGHLQVDNGVNRANYGWNQWMTCSLLAGIGACAIAYKQPNKYNLKAIVFLTLTVLIAVAPLFRYTAALASMISYENIVNRYYYASFLFILIPLLSLQLIEKIKPKLPNLSFVTIFIVGFGLSAVYSRSIDPYHALYKNIKSIVISVFPEKVMYGLSPQAQSFYEQNLSKFRDAYEGKSVLWCTDVYTAHYLQHIYKAKEVLYDGGENYDLRACETIAKKSGKEAIVFPSAPILKPDGSLARLSN